MRSIVMLGGVVALTALCATARAQETTESYLAQHLAAPSQALELKIGTGYTQGVGMLAPGRTVSDASGAGLGASLDVDYRINHRWSIGGEGQYQEFMAAQNTSARGLAFNAGVTYHLDPLLRGDPWLRLGTGFRFFYDNNPTGQQGTYWLRDGFDVLTAKVGYDVRVSEDVAIAPVIGADLNLFIWNYGAGQNMNTPQPATFVYAGLQGRFDIGGQRSGVVAKATPPPPPERIGVTAPQPQSPISPAPPLEEPTPVSPSLAVSEDIIRECKLNLDSIDKAPKFDFDKSELVSADYAVLKLIGECFTTGPMSDQGLRLVGRTDPRGSVEYNQKLGMKRADHVSSFLEQYGIEASRIEKLSRGKLDARGRDEATWAIDRRVDILER
jgi:outer membrane protein OmpA-like peptidoglycan-associated protein